MPRQITSVASEFGYEAQAAAAAEMLKAAMSFGGERQWHEEDDVENYPVCVELLSRDAETIALVLREVGVDPLKFATKLGQLYEEAGRPTVAMDLETTKAESQEYLYLLSTVLYLVTTARYLQHNRDGDLISRRPCIRMGLNLTDEQKSLPLEQRCRLQDNRAREWVTRLDTESAHLENFSRVQLSGEVRAQLEQSARQVVDLSKACEVRESDSASLESGRQYLEAKLALEKKLLQIMLGEHSE